MDERNVRICLTCGRPRDEFVRSRYRFGRTDGAYCREYLHDGTIDVTVDQLNRLAGAARSYNAAKTAEDRAVAMNDWLTVLQEGLPVEPAVQLGLAVA